MAAATYTKKVMEHALHPNKKSKRQRRARWVNYNADLLELLAQLTDIDKAFHTRKTELFAKVHQQTSPVEIAEVTDIEMTLLKEWLTTMPGCSALSAEDQQALIEGYAPLHLALCQGQYSAGSESKDAQWMFSSCSSLSTLSKMMKSETNLSTEEMENLSKLAENISSQCFSEVAMLFRRLQLVPEEYLVLKVILLYTCAHHNRSGHLSKITDKGREIVVEWRNRLILSLFHHYNAAGYTDYEERFGALVFGINGISTAATLQMELYRSLGTHGIVPFTAQAQRVLSL
jgi:hypothetical protein